MSERHFGETPNDWAKREVRQVAKDWSESTATPETVTQLQQAVIEHDADMARLDRNTLSPPETITISLPALRSLTMGILDSKALYLQHLFHADEAEANEAREMFCDGLEAAIRGVQRRFNG